MAREVDLGSVIGSAGPKVIRATLEQKENRERFGTGTKKGNPGAKGEKGEPGTPGERGLRANVGQKAIKATHLLLQKPSLPWQA